LMAAGGRVMPLMEPVAGVEASSMEARAMEASMGTFLDRGEGAAII